MGETLRFIADLHISPLTVEALRTGGCDVVWVWANLSPFASDHEILDYARQEERAVLTQDLDFSFLLALSGHSRPSLVTLRLSETDPLMIAKRILEVAPEIKEGLAEGCAITISERGVRIRRLPIRDRRT